MLLVFLIIAISIFFAIPYTRQIYFDNMKIANFSIYLAVALTMAIMLDFPSYFLSSQHLAILYKIIYILSLIIAIIYMLFYYQIPLGELEKIVV
jgi:hypothetical protein